MDPSLPVTEPELLDGDNLGREERERALADLALVNRLLLGNRPVLAALLPWLARRGIPARVVGLDAQLAHLLIGRERAPGQLRVVARADQLPFAPAAFDWSFSSLFFHHLDEAGNTATLGEMQRVSREGAIVVDLRQSRWTRLLAAIFLRLLPIARVAREDGLVSVERAWSLERVRRTFARFPVLELRRRFPCRFSLVLAARGGRDRISP
jgi:hypothetical protein